MLLVTRAINVDDLMLYVGTHVPIKNDSYDEIAIVVFCERSVHIYYN